MDGKCEILKVFNVEKRGLNFHYFFPHFNWNSCYSFLLNHVRERASNIRIRTSWIAMYTYIYVHAIKCKVKYSVDRTYFPDIHALVFLLSTLVVVLHTYLDCKVHART